MPEPRIWRLPDGSYSYETENEKISVTPMPNSSKNELDWTYVDDNGKLYTINKFRTPDTLIDLGGTPSSKEKINSEDYFHPIKGIGERWTYDWNNNRSPVKAVANSGLGYMIPGLKYLQTGYDLTNLADNLSTSLSDQDIAGLITNGALLSAGLYNLYGEIQHALSDPYSKLRLLANKHPYLRDAGIRYDVLNTQPAASQDIVEAAKKTGHVQKFHAQTHEFPNGRPGFATRTATEISDDNKTFTKNGYSVVIPGKHALTTELHSTPGLSGRATEVYTDYIGKKYLRNAEDVHIDHNLPNGALQPFIKAMPVGTSASNYAEAKNIVQLNWDNLLSTKDKLNFIFRNRQPEAIVNLTGPLNLGYSGDVAKAFKLSQIRPLEGTIVLPTNSAATGTNSYGKTSKLYEKHNFYPNEYGDINFLNFSNEEINRWNYFVAPVTGLYIDPVTKTALTYSFFKYK